MKLNESVPDVRSSSNKTRHVAREKSCAVAFLFPHALYFCVHGMLAHSLLISWLLRLCKPLLKRRRELLRYHRSQLAAGVVAWSGTHDVLVLSRKPGPSAWVGCARHSSSASRCCEERRATGHVSARKSTTAAAAEAEPKKTPPRPWKDTAPLTPAASRAAARALALRKNAWQACTSWARPYRRNRPAQTNCGGALPQRSVELLRVVGGLRSRGVRRHAFMLRLPAARRPRVVQTSPGWSPPGALNT